MPQRQWRGREAGEIGSAINVHQKDLLTTAAAEGLYRTTFTYTF